MKVFCDGAVSGNPGPGAVAFVGYGTGGMVVRHGEMLPLPTTNNIAEYMAIIIAMDFLYHHPGSHMIYSDSSLVIQQIKGDIKVKEPELKRLNKIIHEKIMYGIVGEVKFEWIPREKNVEADKTAKYLLKEHKSGNN